MSVPCGDLQFVDGGTHTNTTIIGANISDSGFTGGIITGAELRSITAIDATTINTILAALTALSPAALRELAEKLLTTVSATAPAPVTQTVDTSLTTTTIGRSSRGYLLAEPDNWLALSSGVVPVYNP